MVRRYLALFLFFTLIFTFALAESIPRHVNPDEIVPEGPSPFELLALYRAVVDAVLVENYSDASTRLGEAVRIYAPEDLRYSFNRFNELLAGEVDELNLTRFYIDLVSRLLSEGFVGEAEECLDEGFFSLARANLTYNELLDAVVEISRRFRIPRGELLSIIDGFGDVVSRYYLLLLNATFVVEELEELELVETSLTIGVNCSEVWVGSPIMVSGFLSTVDGLGLPNRNVTIFLDGFSWSVVTDELGFFEVTVNIPYVYRDYLDVYAVYIPRGLDLDSYFASKSNVVRIKLLYLAPNIVASVNVSRVKPAECFRVSGFVDPPVSRCWFRVFDLRGDVNVSDGSFDFLVVVPADVDEGLYLVEIGSYAEGVLAPSHTSLRFEVFRLPLNVSLTVPWFAVGGFEFEIEGRVMVFDGGVVGGASVTLVGFKSRFETLTDLNGGFKFKFRVPYNVYSGLHDLTFIVETGVPWIRSARVSRKILVVNPITIIVPLALALISIRFVSRRLRRGAPPTIFFEEAQERVEVKVKPRLEVFKDVSSIYFGAVGLIEGRFGLQLRASETVREYLVRVEGVLDEAYKFFEELSFMLEAVVYGGVEVDLSRALRVFGEFRAALMGGG